MPEILEFGLDSNTYALDISYTREIVNSLPVTPIPRAPDYIVGMTNIRGEITTIISLCRIIDSTGAGAGPGQPVSPTQKFVILVSEVAKGDKVGFIVDDVYSVIFVPDADVDYSFSGDAPGKKSFIKGVIRLRGDRAVPGDEECMDRLILYLDIDKVLSHIFELAKR
ncbi:MAG: chemotaxis protein CheW [Methanolinea sp.]|nr:chemotaxis protein CheW [Methanolinea sp.]